MQDGPETPGSFLQKVKSQPEAEPRILPSVSTLPGALEVLGGEAEHSQMSSQEKRAQNPTELGVLENSQELVPWVQG